MAITKTIFLPANYSLTVTASAVSSGHVAQLVSGSSSTGFQAVAASSSVTVAPSASGRNYEIVSDQGELTYTTELAAAGGITSLVADTTPQLGGNLDINSKELDFATTDIDDVIDDDTMATASDTTLATSESIKAYVDNNAGLSNPMTTAEDIIVGGVDGAAGRLAVGTEGQILSVSSGAVAWASAPAGSSSIQAISTTTVSTAVASVDFTGLDGVAYDNYMVVFQNVSNAAAAALWMRVSTDDGSTFLSSANYDWCCMSMKVNGTTITGTNATDDQKIILSAADSTEYAYHDINGRVLFYNPNTAGSYNTFDIEVVQIGNPAPKAGEQRRMLGMFREADPTAAVAVNAIQFLAETGNIESGTFTLYGLRSA